MPPPLWGKIPEVLQLIDYLLLRHRSGSDDRDVKYYFSSLMNRCLDQTASESDICEWLKKKSTKITS